MKSIMTNTQLQLVATADAGRLSQVLSTPKGASNEIEPYQRLTQHRTMDGRSRPACLARTEQRQYQKKFKASLVRSNQSSTKLLRPAFSKTSEQSSQRNLSLSNLRPVLEGRKQPSSSKPPTNPSHKRHGSAARQPSVSKLQARTWGLHDMPPTLQFHTSRNSKARIDPARLQIYS